MNVKKTREQKLCVSCEICNLICPVDAIRMEYERGQFVPTINEETCIDCGKCLEVCPGTDIMLYEGDDFEKWLTGQYIEGCSAFTKNRDVLKNSTSGGAISQLLIKLLKNDDYDGAFVLPFDMFDRKPARLELATTKEEIKAGAKSKYLPASVYNIVKKLEEESNPNYVIVGTPCQLNGIKNFTHMKNINEKNLLYLGLFCDKTLNLNVLNYFKEKFSKKDEELIKFNYRNKEKDGWPGHVKLYFDSDRELIVDRKERIQIKDYFQLERCLYCLDKLNRQADISFGDCYISGKENPGRSNIIIRSEKGKEVWDKYKDIFKWESSSVEWIKKSQAIPKKKKNLEFANVLIYNNDFFNKKGNVRNEKIKKDLTKRRRKIAMGRNKRYNKIKKHLYRKNLRKNWNNRVKDGFEIAKKGLAFLTFYLNDTFVKRNIENTENKNIVIFGGGLFNKGAQAMTFTAVDQIKRRFSDKEVYLLSKGFEKNMIDNYDFNILPFGLNIGLDILVESPILSFEDDSVEQKEKIKDIIDNTYFFIDISGYALSSQMSSTVIWGLIGQLRYLIRIMVAKKFSKPYFILPQSIGPFDYHFTQKPVLFALMNRYLKYPKKIYTREKQGINSLNPFTRGNVERGRDIVLLNDKYQLNNIFKEDPNLKELNIPQNSVGVIPNNHVMKRGNEREIYNLYEKIVKNLKNMDKTVYILRHSQEDFNICEGIKYLFPQDELVKTISEDLNAIELENIIKQFDFIVGSRYHSIIHAYKNGVPAVIIGWAKKYKELSKDFDQFDYLFDIREGLEENLIIEAINKLENNVEKEGKTIEKKLSKTEKNKIFNDIEEMLAGL